MDDWEKLNETSLSEKEEFKSNLNMEYMQIKCMQNTINHGYLENLDMNKNFKVYTCGLMPII